VESSSRSRLNRESHPKRPEDLRQSRELRVILGGIDRRAAQLLESLGRTR